MFVSRFLLFCPLFLVPFLSPLVAQWAKRGLQKKSLLVFYVVFLVVARARAFFSFGENRGPDYWAVSFLFLLPVY